MYNDIKEFCLSCYACQLGSKNGTPPSKPPLQNTQYPGEIFSHWMFDFLKLSITPRSKQFLLVIVDKTSHFTILIPTKNQSAETISKKIWRHVISEFGVMKYLSSDRAAAFTGKVLKHLTENFGVKQILSLPRDWWNDKTVAFSPSSGFSQITKYPHKTHFNEVHHPSGGYTPFEIVTGQKCRTLEQHNFMGPTPGNKGLPID